MGFEDRSKLKRCKSGIATSMSQRLPPNGTGSCQARNQEEQRNAKDSVRWWNSQFIKGTCQEAHKSAVTISVHLRVD